MQKLKISFPNTSTEFYSVLKSRVDQYFIDNKLSKNANGLMVGKTTVILISLVVLYGLIISNLLTPLSTLLLLPLLGFTCAQIGLNIGHDAIHKTYSSNNKTNKLISILFNVIGANDYVWNLTHNIQHHTYTNIPQHDDDIDQPAILRVSPDKAVKWYHKFQYLYVFFLYGLSSLSWVCIKDFVKFFGAKASDGTPRKHPRVEYFRLFFYKAIYFGLFLGLPLIVLDYPIHYILLGFLLMHVFEGLTLALIFHLAHLVEGTDFPEPNANGDLENSWAIHQLHTTADFARKSQLANLVCGGLNFQVEHHLFPKICHVHYKGISPIVEQTAKEFGIPFIQNKTFLGAIASHVRLLKRFGK